MTEFDFSIESLEKLFDSEETFSVDFDYAWQAVGYASKQKAERLLYKHFEENIDFLTNWLKSPEMGRPSKAIYLTWNCCKEFAMMAGTAKGKEVRQYFIKVEEKFLNFAKQYRHNLEQHQNELEQYQNELEALKLARTIPEDLKKLETLSIALAVVVKQRIIGDTPKALNQSFINSEQMQRDLNSSLVANRLGLAFNKQLKVLELIQDTYSPDAYNKLKDMYHTLAVDYNQMVEKQSTSGVSPETVQDFKDRLKAGEEWFRKAEIWQKEIESLAKELETDNLCLKMEIQRQCRLSTALMKDNQDFREANARLVATVNRLEQENQDLENKVNRYKNTRGGLKPFKPLK